MISSTLRELQQKL